MKKNLLVFMLAITFLSGCERNTSTFEEQDNSIINDSGSNNTDQYVDYNGFSFYYNEDTNTYSLRGYLGDSVNVVVPNNYNDISVSTIYESAFGGGFVSVESIELPESLIEFPVLTGLFDLKTVNIPTNISVLPERAFSNCTSLLNIEIPESVIEIDERCFYSSGLKQITIPDSVQVIGDMAFQNCKNLFSVQLSEGISEISPELFSGCTSLAEITIPSNVSKIGEKAFSRCQSLTDVYLPDGLSEFDGDDNGIYRIPAKIHITSNSSLKDYAIAENERLAEERWIIE